MQGLRVDYTTYVLRGETPGLADVVLSLETELPFAAARAGAPADVVFVVRDVRTGRVVASGTGVIALPAGDGDTAMRIRTGALQIVDTASRNTRIARLDLPLGGLPPGRYVALVEVEANGETVHRSRRELDVVTGSRPRPASDAAATVPASEILRGQLAARYLAALEPLGAGSPAAVALARARQDDWPGVDALVGAMEGGSGSEPGVVELALRGLARFAGGDYGNATEALEAAFAADADAPRRALTAFFPGWSHAYRDDDRQAASAWRRAVFLDPELVPAHLALADGYVRLSQPALATQVLRAGLAALPDSPELRERLSRLTR